MGIDGIKSTSSSNQTSGDQTTTPKTTSTDALATKDTFLKLLVAQLRNQNPENPSDGTQFVSQLAQFTTLEQSTQMRDDISAIRAALDKYIPPATSDTTTPTNSQKG